MWLFRITFARKENAQEIRVIKSLQILNSFNKKVKTTNCVLF